MPVLLNEEALMVAAVAFDWVTVPMLLNVPVPALVETMAHEWVLLRLKVAPDLLFNTAELLI